MKLPSLSTLFSPVGSFFAKLKPALAPVGAVLAAAIILAGSWFRPLDVYEYQTYDWRFQIKPKPPVSDQIVMIEIGNDTLEQIGSWPFEREYHAMMAQVLGVSGARMLGFDMLLVEQKDSDPKFAAAAKEFGRVFFAEALNAPESKGGKLVSDRLLAPLLDEYRAAARGVGHVNAIADQDGTRRHSAPVIEIAGKRHIQLAVLMAADYLNVPETDIQSVNGRVRLGDKRTLPIDEKGFLLVNFAGKWDETFLHLSYIDILKSYLQVQAGETPRIDLSVLKDKVCFLGLTATGTHDVNPIPLEPSYPQVGVHANVFNSILQNSFIVRLDRIWNAVILFLLAFAALFLAKIPKMLDSAAACLAVLVAFWGIAIGIFSVSLIWIDLFYPSVVFGVLYLASALYRSMSEKRKRELMEAELSIASNIQRSFLPSSLPEIPGLDMTVHMKPAKHVGGDLYSIIKMDDGDAAVMLGDVSGKGTPAALFMAKSVSEFKFNSRGTKSPAEVLTKLNESLAGDESTGLFVTVTYAVFSLVAMKVTLSNGGHLPVLRVRADGTSAQFMPEGGMPIALMPGVEFANLEEPLQKGDVFLFYSDGISEARSTRREDYEMDRLTAAVQKSRQKSAKEIQDDVLEDIRKFVGSAPQHDDMTLIVVKIV